MMASGRKRRAAKVHIRWMIRRDMPEVMEIEKGSFEFPWTEQDFARSLRIGSIVGMVAEFGEDVVGFMIYELHKTRLHLLSLATHPDFRYRSVGQLKSKLSPNRRTRLTLEVRETNVDAQLFFKQQGFRAVQVLKDYYEDSTEDAYVMIWNVDPDQDQRFIRQRSRK